MFSSRYVGRSSYLSPERVGWGWGDLLASPSLTFSTRLLVLWFLLVYVKSFIVKCSELTSFLYFFAVGIENEIIEMHLA